MQNVPQNAEHKISATQLLLGAYLGILLAFGLGRLVIVSNARDPYLLGIAIPTATWFQLCCGLSALLLGIASLLAIGFAVERGTPRQLVYAFFALPLVLFLLEAITLDL